MHHLWCISFSASALMHQLWYISSGASALEQQLWCISSVALALVHQLWFITLVHLLWCISSDDSGESCDYGESGDSDDSGLYSVKHQKVEKWSYYASCGWILWVGWVCVGDGGVGSGSLDSGCHQLSENIWFV